MNVTTVIMLLDTILAERIKGLNEKEFMEFRDQVSYMKAWLRQEQTFELNKEEEQLIREGKLILSIKHLRERTGCCLVEAANLTRTYRAKWIDTEMNRLGKDSFIMQYAHDNQLTYSYASIQLHDFLEYLK